VAGLEVEVEPTEVGLSPAHMAKASSQLQMYIDRGLLPGWLVVVSRAGKVAYVEAHGRRDSAGAPVEPSTLFRAYSMTKPVTAVAAMICYENGLLQLRDPVGKFVPSFSNLALLTGGTVASPETRPAKKPLLVWHLLTHTAGLAYPWTGGRVVGSLLKRAERQVRKGTDLAGWCDAWATVPLLFEPGASWNYSIASDVLGRVVEVASGLPLDKFFSAHIFQPLAMTATSFEVAKADQSRLFSMYALDPKTSLAVPDGQGDLDGRRKPDFFSGGAGLVTSAADYLRFAEMLRQGGELEGTRLLQASSVRYMTKDHKPRNALLALGSLPPPNWLGYGLGVGTTPPQAHGASPSPLAYGWSGGANTYFVVDPGHDLIYMFFTQLTPFKALPLDTVLSTLVYGAITA